MKVDEVVSDDSSAAGESATDALADARCLKCGYSLRGLPENRCPECGTAFDPADFSDAFLPLWPRLMAWYLAAQAAACLLLLAHHRIWRLGSVRPFSWSTLWQSDLTSLRDSMMIATLALVAAIGLYRRRDWGRKVCLILQFVTLLPWLFRAGQSLVNTAFGVASAGRTGFGLQWFLDSLLNDAIPTTIVIILLFTGLRPRSLARGSTSRLTILSLRRYHPRQDWLLTLVALLATVGISRLADPVWLLRDLTFPGGWTGRNVTAFFSPAAAIGICLSCVLVARRIWRRPDKARTALASLVGLVSAAALLQIVLSARFGGRPVWQSPLIWTVTIAIANTMTVLPSLALYLSVVRCVDAKAIWLVTRKRADDESSAASSGS
jgi:hypothetical protein